MVNGVARCVNAWQLLKYRSPFVSCDRFYPKIFRDWMSTLPR